MRTASRWLAASNLVLSTRPLWSLVLCGLVLSLAAALPARTRPHYGGTLRIEVREPNWQDNDAVRLLVFDCLTATGDEGEARPSLATRWQAENGERRWVFTLRSGVVWHDGTPLVAETAAASLEREIPGTALEGSTIRAAGDTIIVESTRPMPELPAALALSRFAIVRTEAGLAIGTGAFRMVSITGNRMALAANDAYWGGRPYLDAVEIGTGRTIRDQWMDAGVRRTDVALVPAEMLRRAQQEGLRPMISGNSELIALVTTRSGAALDLRIRQALAATVDRPALLNFAFQKQGEVALALLPNRLTGYAALFAATPGMAGPPGPRPTPSRALTIGYDAADGSLQLVAERIALNAREHGLQASASGSGAPDFPDFIVARVPLPSPNLQIALGEFAAAVQMPFAPGSGEIEELYRGEHDMLMQARWIPLLYVPRAYSVAERLSGAALDESGRLDLTGAWIEEPR